MRARPGPAIALLVLALGCARESEPVAERPEEPAAPTAEEPDAEPEVAIEDDDAAPAVPVAGTVVVSSGKRPTPVQATPAVGTSRRFIVTVRINTRRGAEPAKLSPRSRFEIETELTSASETGWRREVEIAAASVLREDDVDAEATAAMEAIVGKLVGAKGHVALSRDGHATDHALDVAEDLLADPDAAIVIAGLRTALAEHFIALPGEAAIGEGAKWEVTRRANVQGVETWRVDRYAVKKREGDEIEARAEIAFVSVDVAGQPVGYAPLGSIAHVQGKGEVESRIDLAAAAPIETHVAMELSFAGTDASGAEATGKIGVDLTVDEDFLSRRDHRVALRGPFVQGGLVRGKVAPGTKVWLDKHRVKVSNEGDFLLGFERDARHRARLSFAFDGGATERHIVHVAQRSYAPERIDGLPEEMVKLDGKTRTELSRANKRIDAIRGKITEGTDWLAGFAWPAKGKITSTYGLPRILNGEDRGIHWGVDVALPVGHKVRAPAAGTVVFAEDDVPLSGTLLIIDHGHGLTSSLLHLKAIKVAVGDRVKKGQIVAISGNSGRSTGPHLDWRMNLGDTRIDPQLLVGK